ncbi:MAG TPA: hypothetical protein VKU92_04150 [Acidimicrobiales bacterium]|nr:hypothetical protein [Acidimicrobiales bacterium]
MTGSDPSSRIAGSRPRAAPARARKGLRLVRNLAVLGLLAGVGVAACAAIPRAAGRHDSSTTTTDGPPASSPTSSTLATVHSFHVGIWTFDWKDTTRNTVNPANPAQPIPGRVLTTQVRYPTLRGSAAGETPGAAAATAYGPFPVIVFAHGFGVDPVAYEPLLDAWVRAGFIVVSPIFPDENASIVKQVGGISSQEALTAETDETNEPGDIAFVLQQLAVAAETPGTPLTRLPDLSEVALAGQSDGANVVGALAFGSAYASIWASIEPEPKAVAVLSGEELTAGPGNYGANTYGSGPQSPALLQVQSTADSCNPGQDAYALYSRIDHGPVHLFETLTGASHLDPYVGVQPWAAIVQKVTTEFFEVELHWRDAGLSLARVVAAGSVPGTSSMEPPTDETFADEPPFSCTIPPGLDTGAG